MSLGGGVGIFLNNSALKCSRVPLLFTNCVKSNICFALGFSRRWETVGSWPSQNCDLSHQRFDTIGRLCPHFEKKELSAMQSIWFLAQSPVGIKVYLLGCALKHVFVMTKSCSLHQSNSKSPLPFLSPNPSPNPPGPTVFHPFLCRLCHWITHTILNLVQFACWENFIVGVIEGIDFLNIWFCCWRIRYYSVDVERTKFKYDYNHSIVLWPERIYMAHLETTILTEWRRVGTQAMETTQSSINQKFKFL